MSTKGDLIGVTIRRPFKEPGWLNGRLSADKVQAMHAKLEPRRGF
jgi:hypothetical protein